MALDALVARIREISWSDIPGERPYYAPNDVAASLIALVHATTEQEAVKATGPLFNAGLVHNHSGAVHPAASVAAPILLDIAEQAHPEAVQAALLLLHYAMDFEPIEGFEEAATEDGPDLPLCCALGRQIQARRTLLSERGLIGRRLLAKADKHWRFTLVEASGESDVEPALALGKLDGIMPADLQSADIRIAAGRAIHDVARVKLEYASSTPDGEACLLLYNAPPARSDQTMVIFPDHRPEAY